MWFAKTGIISLVSFVSGLAIKGYISVFYVKDRTNDAVSANEKRNTNYYYVSKVKYLF